MGSCPTSTPPMTVLSMCLRLDPDADLCSRMTSRAPPWPAGPGEEDRGGLEDLICPQVGVLPLQPFDQGVLLAGQPGALACVGSRPAHPRARRLGGADAAGPGACRLVLGRPGGGSSASRIPRDVTCLVPAPAGAAPARWRRSPSQRPRSQSARSATSGSGRCRQPQNSLPPGHPGPRCLPRATLESNH